MLIPPGYAPQVNYPLQAARRIVIEQMVEARGLQRHEPKFETVVSRHLSKVRYRRECRFDALIDPHVLQLARQGRYPPEIKSRSSKKRKK